MTYEFGWFAFLKDSFLPFIFLGCFLIALFIHFIQKKRVHFVVFLILILGFGIQLAILKSDFNSYLIVANEIKNAEKFHIKGIVSNYERTHRKSSGENVRENFTVGEIKFETRNEYANFHIPENQQSLFLQSDCLVEIHYIIHNEEPLIYKFEYLVK